MGKRPTVYDVAARAGVSIATVSFAFSQPHRVKAATLEGVLAAASDLGYIPSASARGLAKGRTGAIGLYSFDYFVDQSFHVRGDERPHPSANDDARLFPLYVDEVQRGVQLECWDRGLALMIGGGGRTAHAPSVTDIAGRVDGLISFAGALELDVLRSLSSKLPVVELGGQERVEGVATVPVDNRTGMRELVAHLIAAHGLRRIAYLGDTVLPEFRQRYDGYVDALRAAGLSPEDARPSRPGFAEATLDSLATLLDTPPEAIVCSTDQEAVVVLDRVRLAGLRVPEDIAVTGFDGIVAGRLVDPPLSTVVQPMEQIGRAAVGALLAVLGSARSAPAPDLAAVPAIRRSCGCR
ncbi:LacI family transcriptional regulator [Rathayibacter sp. ZW T2_19]|uniref:LacI family transcriptional regulator n=1 Tax=Rathayibacter rubneri TaxID=2950106 RepID=A0A9X2E1V9_9MICO|nr:LacI family DNA-binding transcriptional regulator [Rathayibacter rubneri]MCM6762961.1 LacI family transcriptional regulator [Rathayibacter rubneri]